MQNKKNPKFSLLFARLIVSLQLCCEDTPARKYKRKTAFSFVFRSLNRIFARRNPKLHYNETNTTPDNGCNRCGQHTSQKHHHNKL